MFKMHLFFAQTPLGQHFWSLGHYFHSQARENKVLGPKNVDLEGVQKTRTLLNITKIVICFLQVCASDRGLFFQT